MIEPPLILSPAMMEQLKDLDVKDTPEPYVYPFSGPLYGIKSATLEDFKMTDKKSADELAQDYVRENIHPDCGRYCDCYEVSNGFLAGLAAGRAQALEEAAEIALNYGYTLDFHSEHQPWAKEANKWLRSQNLEIEKQIRALKEKP